jgi:hypothetical protein
MLILKRKGWVPDTTNPTNLLTKNQSDVEADTTGFGPAASATLSRDTLGKWEGTASLKVVASGTQVYQGVYLDAAVNPSTTYTATIYAKGAGTILLLLAELDAGNSQIGQASSSVITLNGTWQRITVSRAFGSLGVKARIKAQTDVAQATTFYVDGLMLGKDAGRWVPGQTRRTRRRLVL